MNYKQLYKEKSGTLQQALQVIQSGDVISTALYGNEPREFLNNLHTEAYRLKNATLWSMLAMKKYPVLSDANLKGHIDILTFFYNADARENHASKRYSLIPMNLHSCAKDIIKTKRPNIFVAAVSPMDNNGNFYLSCDLQTTRECLTAADYVIFEVNKQLPIVYGQTAVSIERVNLIYEANYELPIILPEDENDISMRIGKNVASLINDGDCIQLGIGRIPNAIGNSLYDKKHLGIHTEMITSAMGQLMKYGIVDNSKKNYHPGKTIGAFIWGDQDLYNYVSQNPNIELRPAAYVNNPFTISKNKNMVSINSAIQVDLTGQICSESLGSLQFSGTGGAFDFAFGASQSKGGKTIIAIESTASKGLISKIVAQLSPGSVVTIPRNIVDFVVSEYGIAPIRNRTISERVDALINIAHPTFRSQLRKQADELMLW